MASHYIYMSAYFDPGEKNLEEALKIYEELKERNEGHFAAIVERRGDRLWIHHDQRDARNNVVEYAVAFVAECARRLSLTGIWSAVWSNDCSSPHPDVYGGGVLALDLATQAVDCIDSEDMLSFAKKNLEDMAAQKLALPVEVAMPSTLHPASEEWLNDKVGDDWGCYTRVVTVDDMEVVEEKVFLFKTESPAAEFKRVFGVAA